MNRYRDGGAYPAGNRECCDRRQIDDIHQGRPSCGFVELVKKSQECWLIDAAGEKVGRVSPDESPMTPFRPTLGQDYRVLEASSWHFRRRQRWLKCIRQQLLVILPAGFAELFLCIV